jgi:MFS superfamily sulfate permease-like transporter
MVSQKPTAVRAPSSAFAIAPPDGVEGLKKHWRDDLLSGFLVFLIALPLCLGIAMASGFPAISGIFTAIVGGLIATFFGSAPLTIKGPAAGLIVIVLGAVHELGDGAVGYRRALAAIVLGGLVQIAFSRLKAGALGDLFPGSVIHGMMAAIGIIIISKQSHTVLGVAPHPGDPLHLLAQLPHSIANLNPEVTTIGVASLLILVLLPRLPFAWTKKVPAPMIVVITGIALARAFDLEHEHHYHVFLHDFVVGPRMLVQLPAAISSAVTLPDWSMVLTSASIKYTIMFALVGSIESMLSAKAVDTLDPFHRRSSLDKDLLATGIGNVLSGMIGGLPMISEIVRSSANVSNGAKTRWANFFHGLFLLAFVAFLPGLLRKIPLSALAAMLVFTGVRLASPKAFASTWRVGKEQLVIFLSTMLITIATDLLIGVAAGIVIKAIIHMLGGMPLKGMFRPKLTERHDDHSLVIVVEYAAVFSNFLVIKRRLDSAHSTEQSVILDLSAARVVDHTVLEGLHRLAEEWARDGKVLEIRGLESHRRASAHPLSRATRSAL